MALADMAAKGSRKLSDKAASMASSWNNARPRMVSHFQSVGFGPTRTANYEAGIRNATYTPPSPSKWAENWQAKMRE